MQTISTMTRRALVPFCFLIAAAWVVTARAQEFGYHDPIGPENWCDLGPNYAPCCEGTEQSPVNIVTGDATLDRRLPLLKFHYPGTTTLDVVNNGHTVQAKVPEGAGTLEIDGVVYNLLQFHFHTPSEHAVNGEHAPLEMHLVHKTADGTRTAVVGVFIVSGRRNRELQKIWRDLPVEEGEEVEVDDPFHLRRLLPGSKTTYRYPGSLTTPPCSEDVSWNVMTTPITMSPEQIADFQAIFSGEDFPEGNARPLQPLGDRAIATDAKSKR